MPEPTAVPLFPEVKNDPLTAQGLDANLYRVQPQVVRQSSPLFPNTQQEYTHPATIKSGPMFAELMVAGRIRSVNFATGLAGQGWQIDQNGLITATRIQLNNFVPHSNAAFTFTGAWTTENVNVLYSGGRRVSSTVGDSFTLVFYGTSVGIVAEKASNLGKLTTSIDGGASTTTDLYSGDLSTRQVVYQTTTLLPGRHTLTGTVATKNASSSGNTVGIQGFVKSPTDGIKVEDISADLYVTSYSTQTDANGYQKMTTTGTPSGWMMWQIAAFRLSEAIMSDATATDPKLATATNVFYFYNGAATTTYDNTRSILISKISA